MDPASVVSPLFPMKSRRSIHGEGRSTARSPPTQEAEAVETALPKITAETAAEEGCQWPAVGESKAHVYSPYAAPPWFSSKIHRLTSCRWTGSGFVSVLSR